MKTVTTFMGRDITEILRAMTPDEFANVVDATATLWGLEVFHGSELFVSELRRANRKAEYYATAHKRFCDAFIAVCVPVVNRLLGEGGK